MQMQILPADHPLHCPLLDDSPIGRLAVVEWQGELFVGHVETRFGEDVCTRIIHTLTEGENPLKAIYGKRKMEDRAVRKLYERQDEVKAAGLEGQQRDLKKDFAAGVWRIYNREDGRDAIGAMFTGKRAD